MVVDVDRAGNRTEVTYRSARRASLVALARGTALGAIVSVHVDWSLKVDLSLYLRVCFFGL